MTTKLALYLDLGDAFTKGVVVAELARRRLRFPSVVARRLLDPGSGANQLLLDEQRPLLRPTGFEPTQHARSRSYPGADAVLRQVREQPPAAGARFAGWQAATYGADRQVLGTHPSEENIDALIHKALILTGAPNGSEVTLSLLVDVGVKANAIQNYARQPVRSVAFEARSIRHPAVRRVQLTVCSGVLDAAGCAVAALPAAWCKIERTLLIDIGYFRTKLSIVSAQGCEHQEQLDTVGVSDCVRRILRDGQDQGLVEDELAVMRALENCAGGKIRVAGRQFDVRQPLHSAREGLQLEVAQAAGRLLTDYFGRRAELCRGAVITGGGSALVGADLAQRLRNADLGLTQVMATSEASFFLLNGAEHLER
jgi:hypothetical protein